MADLEPVRLAIVGTGGIGSLHAVLASEHPDVELVALSGLDDAASALADKLSVPLYRDYRQLPDVEGVLVATPNDTHKEIGAFFLERRIPTIVEKPIAHTLADGKALCELSERHQTPLLVGQHRRYNQLVRQAREIVEQRLGKLVATNAMLTWRKPDSYYELAWRRAAQAGPLLVNLIHEVDLQRAVCGEIEAVTAAAGHIGRSFEFDDTAQLILHFENGALGTMTVSESTPSPWSWEAALDEGMGHHKVGIDYCRFLGTEGALSFPSLTLWSYDASEAEPGWMSPLRKTPNDVDLNNSYVSQLAHFAQVIRGQTDPIVPGRQGLRSLAVVMAAIESARSGKRVRLDDLLEAA